MRTIENRPKAVYSGQLVTVLGRRWPKHGESGLRYDIQLDSHRIIRDVPERRLTEPQRAEILELV